MPISNAQILNFENLPDDVKVALNEYMDSIELLSEKELNLEFNNKDQYHASIVMSAIFRTSKKSIKIFCGSFSGEISSNPMYLDAFDEAIKNGASVDVVTEFPPDTESPCMQLLIKKKQQGLPVIINVLKPEYQKRLMSKGSEYLRHFTLGDNRMFRYETETNTFKAICNFDDKKSVELLSANFAYLKANADEHPRSFTHL